MDRIEVGDWIAANMLDTDAWDRATETRQSVAVVQAERNLTRWYPTAELVVAVVSYQTVWELQGIDPALRYQKHNVKSVTDEGEQVSFKDGERSAVSPDVRELMGATTDEIAEQEAEDAANRQFGGALR